MADSILVYISKTTFFPNRRLFIIEQIQGKLMTKIIFKFKKPYFWPVFGSFFHFCRVKNIFPKNLARISLIRFSSTMLRLKETWWSNSKESRMEGGTDPTSWNLSGYFSGPTSTTVVDWHLKIKVTEYDVGLTKNYSLTVSMQKISWIHQLIF